MLLNESNATEIEVDASPMSPLPTKPLAAHRRLWEHGTAESFCSARLRHSRNAQDVPKHFCDRIEENLVHSKAPCCSLDVEGSDVMNFGQEDYQRWLEEALG